jgi:peptide/nickel transport system substrate-binding protein
MIRPFKPSFGDMSRRQFGRLSGAGLLLGATGLGTRAIAQTPARGGHLRYGAAGQNSGASLDPATWGTGAMNSQAVWPGIFGNLTEIGPDGSLQGTLAESFESSEGATKWVFTLRQGVEFHNGKIMDAADVIASINHHRGADSTSSAKVLVESIVDIVADGNKVVVTLAAGNADFAYLMSDYHLPIGIATDGKVDWQAGIGTGGYKIDNLEYGVRLDASRHPNYWRDDRAWFESFEFIEVADLTTLMNGIATGEFDLIDRIDLKAKALLEQAGNIVVEETTGTQHYTFPMFCDTGPFDDVNVRLALKLAIDREEMVQKILFGHGRVANDHPIAPPNQFFAEGLEQRIYDPEKAKWHLAQAGHDRIAIDLHVSDAAFSGAVDAAVLYQAQAASAGIDINVIREPTDGYWSNVWTKVPFCACYWGGRPTEDWMFSTVYASDAAWNDAKWRNPRFDSLLLEARVETDPEKRRAMYGEMQSLVRDDGGTVVPMYANYVWARSDKLAHGADIAANWTVDGWKAVDRWWFA